MSVYKSLGYEIAKVHKAIRAQFQKLLKPCGVTVQQFEVMRILKTESGSTAAQLVERIISDSSTIMSILKRLESKAFITRRQDETDRRSNLIYLSKEGQSLMDDLMIRVERYNKQMHDCCTEKEIEIFKHVLSKLYEFSITNIEGQNKTGL